MKFKCKECGREVEIIKEDAYHKLQIGVICKDCYGRWIYA